MNALHMQGKLCLHISWIISGLEKHEKNVNSNNDPIIARIECGKRQNYNVIANNLLFGIRRSVKVNSCRK